MDPLICENTCNKVTSLLKPGTQPRWSHIYHIPVSHMCVLKNFSCTGDDGSTLFDYQNFSTKQHLRMKILETQNQHRDTGFHYHARHCFPSIGCI